MLSLSKHPSERLRARAGSTSGISPELARLLAALEPAQIKEAIRAVAPGLARYPRLNPEALQTAVALVHRTGYAISQGTVVDNGFGIGRAIDEPDGGRPRLAISIAADVAIATESRIAVWKKVLAKEIAAGLALLAG